MRAAWLTVFLLLPVPGSALAAEPPPLGPGEAWLTALPTDLDGAFKEVAQQIRFEPYAGVARGAVGTALARSGNAWDKALLLQALLERGGYQVRLVEGKLEEGNLATLLRGAFPPRLAAPAKDPALLADPELRAAVSTHVWLEVNQGDTWLPVDPSFPRAKLGEQYGAPLRRFSHPPKTAFQMLRIVWREEGRSGKQTLGQVQGRVAELGLRPISFAEWGVPLRKAARDESASSGGVGGLFGDSLTASAGEKKAKPKAPSGPGPVVGMLLQRSLVVGGERRGGKATILHDGQPDQAPSREWLEITLWGPGLKPRTVRRELWKRDQERKLDAWRTYRRFGVGVIPGPFPRAALEEQMAQARALPMDAWTQEAREKKDDPSPKTVEALTRREGRMGAVTTHLLTLLEAQASDAQTARLAREAGVTVVHPYPRVLISGMTLEPGAKKAKLTLDLRLDEVRALPHPGRPSRAAELFQRARGMMASSVEGVVVQAVTGEPAVTTAALMGRAQEEGVGLVAITPANLSRGLDEVEGLDGEAYALVREAVGSGHSVVMPRRALALAGRPRFGWWELDPESGAAVGVMDEGLHQGMAEYSLDISLVGLNPDTGRALGMIIGATVTAGAICGKILEHGEMNQQAVEEVRKLAESVLCYSCPKAEAKLQAFSSGNDCLKYEKNVASAKAGLDFCEAYEKGFKCTVLMLLAAADKKSQTKAEGTKPSVELSCKKWPPDDDGKPKKGGK